MINFDAVDFSECHSKEVMFLLTLCVFNYTSALILNKTDCLNVYKYYWKVRGKDLKICENWHTSNQINNKKLYVICINNGKIP